MELAPVLQSALDAVCEQRFRRARALAGFWAGMRSAPQLEKMAWRQPELATPEPFLAAREAHARAPDTDKPALLKLASALAHAFLDAAAAPAHARALEALATGQVSVELETMSLSDALCELPACSDRVRRAQLANSVNRALSDVDRHRLEQLQRWLEARHTLDLDGPAWSSLHDLDMSDARRRADGVLHETVDAARELLGYRLRQARAGGDRDGAPQDLRFALELPDLREHLSPHAAKPLSEQLIRQLEIDPFAAGTISVDAEARKGRFPGLCVAQLSPGAVAVIFAPHKMPSDLERHLRGLGAAQVLAQHASSMLDAEPARPLATGWLFARVLTLPQWHRRVLRVSNRTASALAQAFALRRLMALRSASARILYAELLEQKGACPEALEAYRSRLGDARFADTGVAGAWNVRLVDSAVALQGLLLSERLFAALREGFNEDWWRNPASQGLLRAFWTAETSREVDSLLGSPPPPDRQLRDAIEMAAR